MKTLLKVALLLCLAVPAFAAGPSCPQRDDKSTAVSGSTITISNDCGGMTATFEYELSGAPSSVNVTLLGCARGSAGCTSLVTSTTTSATVMKPTLDTVYDYYLIQATWTGGTSPIFTVRGTQTTARSGSGTGGGGTISAVNAGSGLSGGGSSGSVTLNLAMPGLTNGLLYDPGSGSLAGIASPTANGFYPCGYNVTASTSVPPTCSLSGVPIDASNPATLLYSDRLSFLNWTSGTNATLPAATGIFGSNYSFVLRNTRGGNLTLTPTTPNNIDGGASQTPATILNGWAAFVYSDNAPNWFSVKVPTYSAFGATCANGLNWDTTTGIGCQGATTIDGVTCPPGSSCITVSAPNAQVATYSVTSADFLGHKTILVASGTFTITLLATAPPAGQYIEILNYGTGIVTVARNGLTINGGTTNGTIQAIPAGAALGADSALVKSDGSNYFTYVNGANASFLGGKTFASPSPIGSGTANTVAASQLTAGSAGVPSIVDLGSGTTTAAMTGQTSATCTPITNMTWNIAASKNYHLSCHVPVTFVASATLQFCLGGPGTATSFTLDAEGPIGATSAYAQISTVAQTAYGTKTTASGAPGAVTPIVTVDAVIQNGATASGTALTLQTAANGTNAITVGANAQCSLVQLN